MSVSWNSVPEQVRTTFLQANNLTTLPELSEVTDAQWNALAQKVGVETVQTIKEKLRLDSIFSPLLEAPRTEGDFSDLVMAMTKLKMEMEELQYNLASKDIKGSKVDMQKASQERQAKMKESLAKMEKAQKSSLAKKIFGWIGAIIGFIVSIAVVVATAGAGAALAVPVIGLVCSAASLTMMGLEQGGVFERAAEKMDSDTGKKWFKIGMGLLMTALSIASAICSFKGVSALAEAPRWFSLLNRGTAIASAVSSLGGGSSDIATAVLTYESTMSAAEAKEMQAWLARLQSVMEEQVEKLKEVIDRLNQVPQEASEILGNIAASNKSIISNMSF